MYFLEAHKSADLTVYITRQLVIDHFMYVLDTLLWCRYLTLTLSDPNLKSISTEVRFDMNRTLITSKQSGTLPLLWRICKAL